MEGAEGLGLGCLLTSLRGSPGAYRWPGVPPGQGLSPPSLGRRGRLKPDLQCSDSWSFHPPPPVSGASPAAEGNQTEVVGSRPQPPAPQLWPGLSLRSPGYLAVGVGEEGRPWGEQETKEDHHKTSSMSVITRALCLELRLNKLGSLGRGGHKLKGK